ncbi:MAG: hypothetical protein AAFX94_19875, partial [Myxococcota bacterium]
SGDTYGAQFAGALSITRGDLDGAQVTAATSIVGGTLRGFQSAGAVSIAADGVDGAQFAGILNVSGGPVSGTQVGVVNVAWGPVSGSQIGVINIAERYDRGVPLGLLNIVKEGQLHLDLWASDIFLSNIGFRVGSEHVYTLVSFGIQPELPDRQSRSGFTIGVGANFDLSDDSWMAFDGLATGLHFEDEDGRLSSTFGEMPDLMQLRGMVGFDLGPASLFAGASLNVFLGDDSEESLSRGGLHFDLEPGAGAGARLILGPTGARIVIDDVPSAVAPIAKAALGGGASNSGPPLR